MATMMTTIFTVMPDILYLIVKNLYKNITYYSKAT
jgi:hypothetical protein